MISSVNLHEDGQILFENPLFFHFVSNFSDGCLLFFLVGNPIEDPPPSPSLAEVHEILVF